jgi:Uncharacterized protein conserved in bacteria (DUF2252)
MDILQATKSYEQWMRNYTTIVESHLRYKHEQMKEDLFLFFRGTYYRWAQLWPEICPDLCDAPRVLCSADLHVNSFGTWRDSEGRLAWGVDDFDESYPLPYTHDLVRLAASLKVVIESKDLTIKLKRGCEIILNGYRDALDNGGDPIVLAENEQHLEKLGVEAFKPPKNFWEKLNQRPALKHGMPHDAKQALEKMLPDPNLDYKVVRREAGMGSLGQQRFVAIANWNGGCIAREAKAMVPSASTWLDGHRAHGHSYYEEAIKSAVRSHDPYQQIVGHWLIRRLSPDSNPVDIIGLPKERDEETLVHAMGAEAANVHLGTRRQIGSVLKDLRQRKSNWLISAAKKMAKAMTAEWRDYRKS